MSATALLLPDTATPPSTIAEVENSLTLLGFDVTRLPVSSSEHTTSDRLTQLEAEVVEEDLAEPPLLVGWGEGALIAQGIACDLQTRALVLIDPSGPRSQSWLPFATPLSSHHAPPSTFWSSSRSGNDFPITPQFVEAPVLILAGPDRRSRSTSARLFHAYGDADYQSLDLGESGLAAENLAEWLEARFDVGETSRRVRSSILKRSSRYDRSKLPSIPTSLSSQQRSRQHRLLDDSGSLRGRTLDDPAADRGTVLSR